MEVLTKKCKSCLEEKPRWAFYRNLRNADGLYYKCAECTKRDKKPSELEKIRNVGLAEFNHWKK